MSQSLDRGELVGYDSEAKTLVVTLSEETAAKMKADGWTVTESPEIGSFISIQLQEFSETA